MFDKHLDKGVSFELENIFELESIFVMKGKLDAVYLSSVFISV